jgi:hypothetical protein
MEMAQKIETHRKGSFGVRDDSEFNLIYFYPFMMLGNSQNDIFGKILLLGKT